LIALIPDHIRDKYFKDEIGILFFGIIVDFLKFSQRDPERIQRVQKALQDSPFRIYRSKSAFERQGGMIGVDETNAKHLRQLIEP